MSEPDPTASDQFRLGPEAVTVDAARIARVLRARALGLGAGIDEAEDLAQQAIATVLTRHPDKLGHAGYMAQAVTRLWLDRQRSIRARVKRMRDVAARAIGLHGSQATSGPSMDDGRARAVREAIDGLPPRQRAAMLLRVVEGLGYAEIAEAMECSQDAARASLHEARGRLRAVLTARGIEP